MSTDGMPERVARRLGYALKRAQHALRTRMDDAMRRLGLTAPQYAVLTAVELEAGISNARLARAAFVTPQTMQGILANLEREGFLVREPDPSHGRILRTALTPRGRATIAEAHRIADEVEGIMIAGLGAGDAGRLAAMLSRCADDLARAPADLNR